MCSYLYLKQAKMSCFSFNHFSSFSFQFYLYYSTKLENRRAEQVLLWEEDWHLWEGGGVGERV
jgi:hypothetical protein